MLPALLGSLNVLVLTAAVWARRRLARRPSTSLLRLLLACLRVRIATWLLPIPEARMRYEKFCQRAFDQFENRLLGLDEHDRQADPAADSHISAASSLVDQPHRQAEDPSDEERREVDHGTGCRADAAVN